MTDLTYISPSAAWLVGITSMIRRAGSNPDEDFFYLAGPMSNRPQFNFPEFHRVGDLLRAQGYNIVSPAELDDPQDAEEALASPDGAPGSTTRPWADFLARDLVICSLPTCVGAILMPEWEESRGARLETYVLSRLGKPLYAFEDGRSGPLLTEIARDMALVYREQAWVT
jgi:hypothetical protein